MKVLPSGAKHLTKSREYTDEDKFFARIEPDTNGGCWLWSGPIEFSGYGVFCRGYTRVKAHRYSALLHFGEIPEGMFVCHKCDIPACVNPEHLFFGTAQDNMKDMVRKGRNSAARDPERARAAMLAARQENQKGERNPMSKLTEGAVREILMSSETSRSLARKYGVRDSAISRIRRGKRWAHVKI